MEPRTGKTKVSIDYLSALSLAGKIDRAVIVAPARVLDVWVEEFHTHCPVNYHLHVWDKDARKHPLPKVSPARDLTVILVNYEAFGVGGKMLASGKRSRRTGRFSHRQALEKWLDGKPAAMILDESHKIKSTSGRASTLIVSMAPRYTYRLILTGTPVTKATRVFDVYMQWKFLNPDRFAQWPTSESFKQYFGMWTNRNGYPQLLKVRNTNVLTDLIYQDSYRVRRDECFDLPERTSVVRHVSLSRRTGEAYDELAASMITRIEDNDRKHVVEASIPLVLTLKLTQITGGFVTTVDDDTQERYTVSVGTEKLDALDEILDDAIDNDEKVVVCARFRAEMDAIVARVHRKKLRAFEVRGGLSREEVTTNIRKFREHEGCAVVVMNPQAGGVGIDLSTASQMVWYSLTPSWVNYTQACDRIALSKKATVYTYLLAKGTVDTVLYRTLINDGNISEEILRDPRKVLRK